MKILQLLSHRSWKQGLMITCHIQWFAVEIHFNAKSAFK
jgi:hypothetical protein